MQRISAINPATAGGKAKQLLDGVQAKLGMTPQMMKTMAVAPATLEAYLNFGATLATGTLDAKFREQIALTVAQANSCAYCLAAHSALGKMVGLSAEDIRSSREAHAQDAKRNAGLRFAQALVIERGDVSDQTVAAVKAAGYSAVAERRRRREPAAPVPCPRRRPSSSSAATLILLQFIIIKREAAQKPSGTAPLPLPRL